MKLGDLLGNAPVTNIRGDQNTEITGITKDSRKVGKGYMYFVTPKNEPFITYALSKGPAAVVVTERDLPYDLPCVITVENPDTLLGVVASKFYGSPSSKLHVTGITGTNGKTTTSYLIESIYSRAGKKTGVIGTISYRFDGRTLKAENTTPGAEDLHRLLGDMALSGVDSVVMEVSSHALDQRRIEGVDFDTAIFTNLTRDHLDYHGTFDRYKDAKRLFFNHYLKGSSKENLYAILNLDDPAAKDFVPEKPVKTLFYSFSKQADAYVLEHGEDIEGLRVTLSLMGDLISLKSPLLGQFNVLNILAACLAGYSAGIQGDDIARGVETLQGVPGRLQRVRNERGIPVFVDYAHTPDALKNVLELLAGLKNGRLIVIFGCGGDRDKGKRPLMGEIASRLSDFVVLTSDNPRSEDPGKIIADIQKGVRGSSYKIIENRRDAIFEGIRMASRNDVVLVAGKGHEDYQIIGTEVHPFSDNEVVEESLRVAHG